MKHFPRWQIGLGLLGLLVGLLLVSRPGQAAGLESGKTTAPEKIHIFFSGGCADYWPYLEETLLPALETAGLPEEMVEVHDFTRPGGRAELLAMVVLGLLMLFWII